MISHSSKLELPGCSGLSPIPRKMSGSAISSTEALTLAISTPSVVFDNAIHLYPGPGADCRAAAVRDAISQSFQVLLPSAWRRYLLNIN